MTIRQRTEEELRHSISRGARYGDNANYECAVIQNAVAELLELRKQKAEIDCPLCSMKVVQVASATLDLALSQHVRWVCTKRPTLSPEAPITLNGEQDKSVREWAADDRLWTPQETAEFYLRTFARDILKNQQLPGLLLSPEAQRGLEIVRRVLLNKIRFSDEQEPDPEIEDLHAFLDAVAPESEE